MPRTLDDIQGDRYQQIVSSATPSFQTYPTPYMNGAQMMDSYRQKMFSTINVGSMQAMGLAQAQSLNINNPYGGGSYGAAAGMAPPWMMTSANMGVFRPGPPQPPPALMSTPGVTNQFTNPADLAVQYQLMRTGMFADPGQAAQNYGRMKVHQFGQQYGGAIGTGLGLAATPFAGGLGGSIIGSLGQMAMENLNNIPGVGSALRWGVGALNQNVAEQLSWTGGAQHATLGNVALGRGEMGLGGRGMNIQASMGLGRNLRQLSQQTGRPDEAGAFNQTDMINLLRTAGDTGFLESATNVDQITKTVGNLMKLVGSLAKITGDPDFRNNLQELGQMRNMGFSMGQGVEALKSMNTWSRMAGVTRGELMQGGALPGATRAAAAGLTPGVGLMAGAYGMGQARMLQGTFSETQKALFGDIGQTLTEGQIGFGAGVTPYLVPGLLSATGGEIGLDQSKIQKLLKGGALDMNQLAGRGAMNLQEVARKSAEARAKLEGRDMRQTDVADAMLEIQGRLREFQSDFLQQIGPEKADQLRYQLFQGLKNQGMGEFAAAGTVSGGNLNEAQILLKKWKDPRVKERMAAVEQQDYEARHAQMFGEARQRLEAREEEQAIQSSWFRRTWRDWQKPSEYSERDIRRADEEALEMQRDTYAAGGLQKVAAVGPMTMYGEDILSRMREGIRTGARGKEAAAAFRRTRQGERLTAQDVSLFERLRGIEAGTLEMSTNEMFAGFRSKAGTTGKVGGETEKRGEEWQWYSGREIRAAADAAADTTEALANYKDLTDSNFATMRKNLMEAIGGSGAGEPPASVMATIRSRILAKASGKAKVTVEDLQNEAAAVLSESGVVGAYDKVRGQGKFWKNFVVGTVMRGGNEDAKKNLQQTADTFTLLGGIDLKKGEEAIRTAEKRVSKALQEKGMFVQGTEGAKEQLFTQEQRDAFQTFFKSARAEGAGQEGGMISLLAAQEARGAAEGASKSEQEEGKRAGTALEELATDPKYQTIVDNARTAAGKMDVKQRDVLARMGQYFQTGVKAGSGGKDVLKSMAGREEAVLSGKEKGTAVEAVYAGAEVMAAAQTEKLWETPPTKEGEKGKEAKADLGTLQKSYESLMRLQLKKDDEHAIQINKALDTINNTLKARLPG